MKIAVMSDVHLEFGDLPVEDVQADVLVLSGDICIASEVNDRDAYEISEHIKSNRYHQFFQNCCARYANVLYVCGNHEHYHGDYHTSYTRLKEKLGYLTNLHILDKESVMIDGVLFVGGTLWTDMNREDPNTLTAIRHKMNDYRIIDDSSEQVMYKAFIPKDKPVGMTDKQWWDETPHDQRHTVEFKTRNSYFTPEKSVIDHKAMLSFINSEVRRVGMDTKVVVVGHHAPSKQSTKPGYERDMLTNGAYSSDLSNFILDHPQIKLWTHGHTHSNFDYMIGTARIFCNPRGYVGYERHEHASEPYFAGVVEI